jgi:hypothetical protein
MVHLVEGGQRLRERLTLPFPVCAEELPVSEMFFSFFLRKLNQESLITARREGKRI